MKPKEFFTIKHPLRTLTFFIAFLVCISSIYSEKVGTIKKHTSEQVKAKKTKTSLRKTTKTKLGAILIGIAILTFMIWKPTKQTTSIVNTTPITNTDLLQRIGNKDYSEDEIKIIDVLSDHLLPEVAEICYQYAREEYIPLEDFKLEYSIVTELQSQPPSMYAIRGFTEERIEMNRTCLGIEDNLKHYKFFSESMTLLKPDAFSLFTVENDKEEELYTEHVRLELTAWYAKSLDNESIYPKDLVCTIEFTRPHPNMKLSSKWTVGDALYKILEADKSQYGTNHNFSDIKKSFLRKGEFFLLPYKTLAQEEISSGDTIHYDTLRPLTIS